MSPRRPSVAHLTISIAAYNDAPTIGPLIAESLEVAAQLTDDYEVFVIDDGSQDETPRVLAQIAADNPRVKVHTHPVNLGFGPTIRESYQMPDSDWVFFLPGDAQVPASTLLPMYKLTDRYNFIIGRRAMRQDNMVRRFVSWSYNLMISVLARRRIYDVNSVALASRHALEAVTLKSRSAFIHAEMALEIMSYGFGYGECDIAHRPREFGTASGNKIRVILATIWDMLAYASRKARGR